MTKSEYPDCFETCQAVADSEGVLGGLLEQTQYRVKELERERDELKAERDTWAIAAEINCRLWGASFIDFLSADCYLLSKQSPAGYALAEAYGEKWREKLEAKDG